MALFEGYERKIDKINGVLAQYGLNSVEECRAYAYRDRKNKKRNFRALWIQRINAAARLEGMSYSK